MSGRFVKMSLLKMNQLQIWYCCQFRLSWWLLATCRCRGEGDLPVGRSEAVPRGNGPFVGSQYGKCEGFGRERIRVALTPAGGGSVTTPCCKVD